MWGTRTTPFGEIRLIESGNGYADNDRYFTSDQQLYYFLLLSEYLRVTGEYAFLDDMIQPYPAKGQAEIIRLGVYGEVLYFSQGHNRHWRARTGTFA